MATETRQKGRQNNCGLMISQGLLLLLAEKALWSLAENRSKFWFDKFETYSDIKSSIKGTSNADWDFENTKTCFSHLHLVSAFTFCVTAQYSHRSRRLWYMSPSAGRQTSSTIMNSIPYILPPLRSLNAPFIFKFSCGITVRDNNTTLLKPVPMT